MSAPKAWDMEHVNRVNIPLSSGDLGRVVCPTEGCGYVMEMNGRCPRCGWTLIVTRRES